MTYTDVGGLTSSSWAFLEITTMQATLPSVLSPPQRSRLRSCLMSSSLPMTASCAILSSVQGWRRSSWMKTEASGCRAGWSPASARSCPVIRRHPCLNPPPSPSSPSASWGWAHEGGDSGRHSVQTQPRFNRSRRRGGSCCVWASGAPALRAPCPSSPPTLTPGCAPTTRRTSLSLQRPRPSNLTWNSLVSGQRSRTQSIPGRISALLTSRSTGSGSCDTIAEWL